MDARLAVDDMDSSVDTQGTGRSYSGGIIEQQPGRKLAASANSDGLPVELDEGGGLKTGASAKERVRSGKC